MPTLMIVGIVSFSCIHRHMRNLQPTHFKLVYLVILVLLCVSFASARNQRRSKQTSWTDEPETIRNRVVQTAFQQDVDNFSDDARAMSPRSWGQHYESSAPPAPTVSFDNERRPGFRLNRAKENGGLFRQVESERLAEPLEFFETKPLSIEQTEDGGSSSRLPTARDQEKSESDAQEKSLSVIELDSTNLGASGNSEESKTRIPGNYPIYSDDHTDDGYYYLEDQINGSPGISEAVADCFDECDQESKCIGCRLVKRFKKRRSKRGQLEDECCGCEDEDCVEGYPAFDSPANFSPELGHRNPYPTFRGELSSSTEKFSFEEDGEFPPMREILAQSIFFAEAEFMFLQPSFNRNSVFSITNGGNISSQPFNFDLVPAFRVTGGFESEFGPGFAGEYFQFDNESDDINYVSNGIAQGEVSLDFLGGTSVTTSIIADDLGESINARHGLEVHSTSFYAFKAIKFKRARVNGRFGLQIASVEHELQSALVDSGGSQIGVLNQSSNLDAFGPKFGIDYVRKIGHTPAELIASASGSVLFGDRDQVIENTVNDDLLNLQSDELVTVIDIFFGVQGKQIRSEKRNITFRVGFVNQSWLGGGTALDPSGDFGFQGISLMLGLNR